MELTTGAEVAGYSGHDHCALSRMLVSELRSPLAAVRMGAELLVRSDRRSCRANASLEMCSPLQRDLRKSSQISHCN